MDFLTGLVSLFYGVDCLRHRRGFGFGAADLLVGGVIGFLAAIEEQPQTGAQGDCGDDEGDPCRCLGEALREAPADEYGEEQADHGASP